jgi:hypothetical protein
MLNCTDVIPTNPDILGVGIRAAIYIQNFLSFLPAFWALRDGIITLDKLEAVERQSTTILITAFAVLISAIIQVKTFTLSGFHTYVILSLSWMNNTNTFIYFVLYISYKCGKACPKEERLDRLWSAWKKHSSKSLKSWWQSHRIGRGIGVNGTFVL